MFERVLLCVPSGFCSLFGPSGFAGAQDSSAGADFGLNGRSTQDGGAAEKASPRVSIAVQVLSKMRGCPTAQEMVERVNETVGREFALVRELRSSARKEIASSGTLDLEIRFRALSSGFGRADVLVLDESGASPMWRRLRTFERDVSCAELGLLAALRVSLLAKEEAEAEKAGPAGSTSRDAPRDERVVEEEFEKRLEGESEVEQPNGDAPEGGAEDARELRTEDERAPSEERRATAANGSEPTTAIGRDEETPGFKNWELGGMGVATIGELPGVGLGGGGFTAYGVGPWSLGALVAIQFATGAEVVGDSGRVVGFAPEFSIRGCRSWTIPLKLCADAGQIWFLARGEGISGGDSQGWASTTVLGLSLGSSFALSSRFRLGLQAGAFVPLGPLSLEVEMMESGEVVGSEEIWSAAPVIGRFELQLAFR